MTQMTKMGRRDTCGILSTLAQRGESPKCNKDALSHAKSITARSACALYQEAALPLIKRLHCKLHDTSQSAWTSTTMNERGAAQPCARILGGASKLLECKQACQRHSALSAPLLHSAAELAWAPSVEKIDSSAAAAAVISVLRASSSACARTVVARLQHLLASLPGSLQIAAVFSRLHGREKHVRHSDIALRC